MRLAAIIKLIPESDTHKRAAGVLAKDKTNAEDEWLKLALQAAVQKTNVIGYERAPNLFAGTSFENINGKLPAG